MHVKTLRTLGLFICLVCAFVECQSQIILSSPDGKSKVEWIDGQEQITLRYLDGDKIVLSALEAGMTFDNDRSIGYKPKLRKKSSSSHDGWKEPLVPNKNARIQDRYEELYLKMKGNYSFQLRVFDDGFAYRFIDEEDREKAVENELLNLELPEGSNAVFPQEESMYSHNERTYVQKEMHDFLAGEFASLPTLFDNGNSKVLITEANLIDYPGMFLAYEKGNHFHAKFPKLVIGAKPDSLTSPDRNEILEEDPERIARVNGARAYPWRVFVHARKDRELVASNMVTLLSEESKIEDASWIRPGKVAWDWYNANNIFGVDFESGINTDTYKYYIDFASENGIEYVILDEGWTESTTKIKNWNSELDLPHLFDYAKSKNVGLVLWVLWKPLQEDMENILKLYSSWGAKGIKVDFMQRNDQAMVRSYEEIAKLSAKYKLLVDFHGAFKPSGIEGRWPNILNYEGVKGNEHNKWSADITPEHNVTLPFIRMVAGPMDFTPGSMINKNPMNFGISFFRPMSQGTRCHQMAMYVVYEAPLQMLCENPSIYKKEAACLNFLTKIPTTWDETKVLDGKVGDYIVIARRKGNDWYLAAMSDEQGRTFEIELNFLNEGTYALNGFKDGINAGKYAEDHKAFSMELEAGEALTLELAGGGGWIGVISEK